MKRIRMITWMLSVLCLLSSSVVSFAADMGNDAKVMQSKEEEARESLLKKTQEKDIYALVYMADVYEVKEEPNLDSATIAELKSADTVRIRDFALEWVTEYEEIVPKIWFCVEFYVGETIEAGYVQEEHLVTSDELLKAWKQEFCSLFEIDEMLVFEERTGYADVEKFPYSYQVHLKELKDKHPNWVFVVMNVNRDWKACVEEQLGDFSWIYYNQPAEFLGAKINSSWHYASKAGIAYYMDPRNFLTQSNIFMFEQNTYNASYHTVSALQKFLNNTFMSGIIPDDSNKRTYATVIFESGKKRGLSPFNLAARVIQEQGVNGNSQMISGKYPGYEGYYNFYNIQASGSTNAEVYKNGLSYAKSKGWNTRAKSLEGGADFIGNGYILKGQDTLYLQKFDVLHDGWPHQYMQNIMAPYTEGRSMRSMYENAGSINSDFVFKIPVFLNMPSPNPLKSISFAEAKNQLFLLETSATKIPYLKEDGTTDYYDQSECVESEELQVLFEAVDNTKEITDDTTVTWSVKDKSIVSLTEDAQDNSKAIITALKSGSTTITAKVGKFKITKEVTVRIPMTEASLEQKEVSILCGQGTKIPVNYAPFHTSDDSEISWWWSKDEAGNIPLEEGTVVRVKNGSIFGVGKGEIYGHAKIGAFDGKQKNLTCKVSVKDISISFQDEAGNVKVKTTGIYGKKLAETEALSGDNFAWEQTKSGYVFLGWYTQKAGKGVEVTPDTVISGNLTAYSYFVKNTAEFFVKPIGDRQYTGGKIKPEILVCHKGILLAEDKDYRVTFENNTNVSTDGTSAIVTVTGIGTYQQEKRIEFKILPKDIEEGTVTVSEILLPYTGNLQKAVPQIKDENRTLQRGKDYVLEYPANRSGAYLEAGIYPVKVKAQGNYTGESVTYITITRKRKITDAVLKELKSVSYAAESTGVPQIHLTYGNEKLQENTDYLVSFYDNDTVGTATVVITGIGKYTGSREEHYLVTGADLSKGKITGIKEMEFTGNPLIQKDYVVTDAKGNELKENEDYQVTYKNNKEAGAGKMILTGMGSYEGELVKQFTIHPYRMEQEYSQIQVTGLATSYVYEKAGVKPKVTVTYQGVILKENVDYTLQYKNNGNVGNRDSENKPAVIVVGKGNFAGEIAKEFEIVPQDVSGVSMTVKDIVFKAKKSFCFAQPVLKEKTSQSILTKEKDYSPQYRYTYVQATELWDGSKRSAAETVGEQDIPMPGTVIKVTVTAQGNYKGQISCTYKILNAPQEMQEELQEAKENTKNKTQNLQAAEETVTSLEVVETDKTDKTEEVSEIGVGSNLNQEKEELSALEREEEIIFREITQNPQMEKEEVTVKITESLPKQENTTVSEQSAQGKNMEKAQSQALSNEQKILYREKQANTEKSFDIIFKILGCGIAVSYVIIMLRKRKKED